MTRVEKIATMEAIQSYIGILALCIETNDRTNARKALDALEDEISSLDPELYKEVLELETESIKNGENENELQ